MQTPRDQNDAEELDERIETLPPPTLRNAKYTEHAQLMLAAAFSATYLLVMLLVALYSLFWEYEQQKVAAIAALLSPLGAIVGGIIGFYFGSKTTS